MKYFRACVGSFLVYYYINKDIQTAMSYYVMYFKLSADLTVIESHNGFGIYPKTCGIKYLYFNMIYQIFNKLLGSIQ